MRMFTYLALAAVAGALLAARPAAALDSGTMPTLAPKADTGQPANPEPAPVLSVPAVEEPQSGDGTSGGDSGGGASAAPASPAPVASDVSNGKGAFAGIWDIKTERGDVLHLTIKQTDNKVTGSLAFKNNNKLEFTGRVENQKTLKMVWQLAKMTGTGELQLQGDGKSFKGTLILADGSGIQGGTWNGSRPAPAATLAALPLGDAASGGSSAASGFVDATITGTVSVRDGPSTKNTKVIDTLHRGDKVSVKCATNGWCELSEGGRYVSKSFVDTGGGATASAGAKKKVSTASTKKKVASTQTKKKQEPQKSQQSGTIFGFGGSGLIIGFPIVRH